MTIIQPRRIIISERTCFVYQAVDGIRDLYVTGVQTCALPISVAARRSHQGCAARREISHRSSALADRVWRGGGGVRAVAEVRHLDLFPADGAGAGGFPVDRKSVV